MYLADAAMEKPAMAWSGEVIVHCPGCKALQTVWIEGSRLGSLNRKFHQQGDKVYHECGSEEPCKLYHI